MYLVQVKLPPNPYNRGFWRNLSEVLWWEQHLQRAAAERAVMKPKETGSANDEGRPPGERGGVETAQEYAQRQQPCGHPEAASRQGLVTARRQKQC